MVNKGLGRIGIIIEEIKYSHAYMNVRWLIAKNYFSCLLDYDFTLFIKKRQSCVAYEWMVNHFKKGPKQGTLPFELSYGGSIKQWGHKENETTSMYCLIIHI